VDPATKKPYLFCENPETELGWSILFARPRILSKIASIKIADPDSQAHVLCYANTHVLYHTADKFLTFGHHHIDRTPSHGYDLKDYIQINLDNEPVTKNGYVLPPIKKEWTEKAKSIISTPYVSFSARLRSKEGYRNFSAWGMIGVGLKSMGVSVICTTPKNMAYDMPVPYLEDFIGPDNPDSMGIEMAIHNESQACVCTNSGAAGIMLLSNPKNFVIFGGVTGFAPGWDGLHTLLSTHNEGYITKMIDTGMTFNGCDTAPHPAIADVVIKQVKKIL
jgi:hypothetical protein